MKLKLTEEEIETMSYDDVAYKVFETYNKKMKIQELFKYVTKAMKLPEEEFEEGIADFFELLVTDKRFIMLENGFWDLKSNHNKKFIVNEDDDDEEELHIQLAIEEEIKDEEEEIDYDDESEDDDEEDDDELDNLIILDEDEVEEEDL